MGKTQNKKIPIKPILKPRVCCKACFDANRNDRWLRRLYVLWASPPPDPADGQDREKPVFHLAQSDGRLGQEGYLSPLTAEGAADPVKTVSMVKDHEYYIYCVRHPDIEVAKELLKDLNTDPENAKKKWGEWKTLKLETKSVGKNKKEELLLSVPEDPEWFVPKGSELYRGWVLFRDMAGTGNNMKPADIQCPPLKEQVARLQYHLGALRYPIGNQWHPYSPEPWTKSPDTTGRRDLLYPNEGIFDAVTWNCVLAFQRDAGAGAANRLDSAMARSRTALWEEGTFNPTKDAKKNVLEIQESQAYVSKVPANRSEEEALVSGLKDNVVVDKNTGDGIQKWLEKKLRKPGKILVATGQKDGPFDSWIMEDALEPIRKFSDLLVKYGCPEKPSVKKGETEWVRWNCSFRDARMSVEAAGEGQARLSIHKSGYAIDFAMNNFVGPRESYPIYFVHDESEKLRVRWLLYVPVKNSSRRTADQGDDVEYLDEIRRWMYEYESQTGGHEEAFKKEGYCFLNFTRLAKQCGFVRIGAHKTGWQGGDPEKIKLSESGNLNAVVKKLLKYRGHPLYDRSAVDSETKKSIGPVKGEKVTINGTQVYTIGDLQDMANELKLWIAATKGFAATPDIEFDPSTKEGDALIRVLKGGKLKGKKVLLIVGEEGKGIELELNEKTEFPPKGTVHVRPLTSPVVLKSDDTLEIPTLGFPQHMEWWHLQYEPGYDGKKWGKILEQVGWTREGLLGRTGKKDPGILGQWGLGYTQNDLSTDAA